MIPHKKKYLSVNKAKEVHKYYPANHDMVIIKRGINTNCF